VVAVVVDGAMWTGRRTGMRAPLRKRRSSDEARVGGGDRTVRRAPLAQPATSLVTPL